MSHSFPAVVFVVLFTCHVSARVRANDEECSVGSIILAGHEKATHLVLDKFLSGKLDIAEEVHRWRLNNWGSKLYLFMERTADCEELNRNRTILLDTIFKQSVVRNIMWRHIDFRQLTTMPGMDPTDVPEVTDTTPSLATKLHLAEKLFMETCDTWNWAHWYLGCDRADETKSRITTNHD